MEPKSLSPAPKLTMKAAKRLVMAIREPASERLIIVYLFNLS